MKEKNMLRSAKKAPALSRWAQAAEKRFGLCRLACANEGENLVLRRVVCYNEAAG